jgi:hypothetical protein
MRVVDGYVPSEPPNPCQEENAHDHVKPLFNGEPAKPYSHCVLTRLPNVPKLSGDGGEADGVRWSAMLAVGRIWRI